MAKRKSESLNEIVSMTSSYSEIETTFNYSFWRKVIKLVMKMRDIILITPIEAHPPNIVL